MMSNINQKLSWQKVKLGDLITSPKLPNKVKRSDYSQKGKIPIYDQGSIEIAGYTNDQSTVYSGFLPAILFGDHTLTINIVNEPFALGADGVQILDVDDSIINRKYFYYAIKGLKIKSYGYERHLKYLRELEIYKPNLETQSRIAYILSAFDDKIELNNKISATLEKMAQAIFNEWFVKFRFPGHEKVELVDSELGKIPKEWKVKELGTIADVQWGDTSVTKASYISEGYPAYSASGPDGFRKIYDFDRIGIVLSAIGANCGITWLARNRWSVIKNTIRFWSTDNRVSTEYLFLATIRQESWPQRGSAQPFITMGDARKRKILVPAENILRQFNDFVVGAYSKIDSAWLENQKLAKLRDLLLPKLMKGETRVI